MRVIRAENVNDAFYRGLDLFQVPINYRRQKSRNGITLEAKEAVSTVYNRPWERVLFDKARDANPFFHLVEAIWMLTGSKSLDPIIEFNSGMIDFSDDGETLNGAYGFRWFEQFDLDQIQWNINVLEADPESRRAVLQMWDPSCDLNSQSTDIPCNTNIYFKIREGNLNMTVCNRSNDMLWGAYGANAVHMSVLQEYVAAALNVSIGTYTQISDSLHIYENKQWKKLKNIELPISPMFTGISLMPKYPNTYPLVDNASTFIAECKRFLFKPRIGPWDNQFFPEVLEPMVNAFRAHKRRDYVEAKEHLGKIKAEDWEIACKNWITKRQTAYELK